ncbi:hypothetical protein BaRGS_00020216 [Batillaria attramentaria]|uniref:Uncharacterized protein n=1 Tax=Batillaria attramentaria TaxID=370345 RepID=A0ABD0KNB7_9CAEN
MRRPDTPGQPNFDNFTYRRSVLKSETVCVAFSRLETILFAVHVPKGTVTVRCSAEITDFSQKNNTFISLRNLPVNTVPATPTNLLSSTGYHGKHERRRPSDLDSVLLR